MRRTRHGDQTERRGAEGSARDRFNPPDGVELVATMRGHIGMIGRIAWSPDGNLLATPSRDGTTRMWDRASSEPKHTIAGHPGAAASDRDGVAAFDRHGKVLATVNAMGTVRLWEVGSWHEIAQLAVMLQCTALAFSPRRNELLIAGHARGMLVEGPTWEVRQEFDVAHGAFDVVFNPEGSLLAINQLKKVQIWDINDARVVSQYKSPTEHARVAFAPHGTLLLASDDTSSINLWDYRANKLVGTIEGHTGYIHDLSFMPDGRLLASKSSDGTVRLWDPSTWNQLAVIPEPGQRQRSTCIAFHPSLPLLATVGRDQGSAVDELVHIWRLDVDRLLGRPRQDGVAYKSAKIVLLGESGAGKTGLGYRLATGTFKDHSSTHGQQFWLIDALRSARAGEPHCEAILWDLAGQPDYRIIHTLFIDDADIALIVFDPTRDDDPLQGVDYWLSQLSASGPRTAAGIDREVLLVAARADRGAGRLSSEEIAGFCAERGIRTYVVTSALNGEGIAELIRTLRAAVRWDQRPPTITTKTFQWIKATALGLKEGRRRSQVILSPAELRARLTSEDETREFTDSEMLAALGHLTNHGYVAMLKTSRGESRILLAPDLLNNIAASMVLEARRNQKGLGSLAEQSVLAGDYAFPELDDLSSADREVLLDSAVAMFLAHNVCFRETDPLRGRVYLVFPELINLRRPAVKHPEAVTDGVAYTVTGAVENVYASLVVLLGFTDVFTRTNQWRNQAEYRVGDDLVCGFRLEAEREGELDFVLYFGTNTGEPIRMLFQSLFESFLAAGDLSVRRFEPVVCRNDHQLNRAVVREHLAAGRDQAFCHNCGDRIALPCADTPIQLNRTQTADLVAERRTVDKRAQFEQALFRLNAYAARSGTQPTCFISYAWGNQVHERWVERELATDLDRAGIVVLLDRWENARVGASVTRFVELAGHANRVIVVGTPLYLSKYDNNQPMGAFVCAAEGDLVGTRMLGTESHKETVLPILLEGTQETSLPLLLRGRVFSDFREPDRYFASALDLILSLHGIPPRHSLSIELHDLLDSTT